MIFWKEVNVLGEAGGTIQSVLRSADITLEGSPLTGVNGSPFVLGNTGRRGLHAPLLRGHAVIRAPVSADRQ